MPKITSIVAYLPGPSTSGLTCGKKREREGHTSDSSQAIVPMSDISGYDTDFTTISRAASVEGRPKRKRGRPPTTGQYVGLHAAKKQLAELKLRDMELEVEREMEKERAARREKRQPPPPSGRPPPPTAGQTPAEALLRRIEEEVEAIRKVASSSKHLKGTFVRILKEASASIMEAVESITSRTSSREVRILQDENNRLRVELQIIKSEMGDIRREMAEGRCVVAAQGAAPPTPAVKRPSRAGRDPPTVTGEVAEVRTLQEVEARLIRQVGDIIDARLAAFTDRLAPERPFRPPLGARGSPRPDPSRRRGQQ